MRKLSQKSENSWTPKHSKMMRFTERQKWEWELAAARERMLNTKDKQLPDPLQLDVTNDLHTTAKKIADGQQMASKWPAKKNLT
ncbi:hypothetical protein ES703_114870 [subsurface metagenome]